MKSSVVIIVVLCAGIAAAVLYLNHRKSAPVPAPAVATPSPVPESQPVAKVAAPRLAALMPAAPVARPQASAPVPAAAAPAAKTSDAISQAVDHLLSAKDGREKHELFQQLIQSGQMDAAIAELKLRAAANPNDPEIPTTIGEAMLNQVRALKESGAGLDQMGILAMQADQSFDAALKIDPQNWEANFVKASSMYYWPANPQMDNDVVQRLSGLIDQQENLPSRPEFAAPYLVLGNEYQKLGDTEKAMATWRLGLNKYPDNSALQQKVNGN